jgi:hypothetical protein
LRGFKCGTEEKKWGPRKEDRTTVISIRETQPYYGSTRVVFRSISSLDDDLTPAEWRNIHHFHSLWLPKRYAPRRYPSELGTRVAIPLFNIVIGHTSKLYRTAILVLITHLQTRDVADRRAFEYLDRFYHQAQDCINNQAVSELVYASYIIAVYALIGGVSPQMAIDNCSQFFHTVIALKSLGTVVEDECLWLETLWQRILSSLYYIYRDNIVFDRFGVPVLSMKFEPLQRLLYVSTRLLPSEDNLSNLKSSTKPEWVCQKVYSFSIYMQFYWDCFLYQAAFTESMRRLSSARVRLQNILGRIIHLISHLPSIDAYVNDAYPTLSELETIHYVPTNDFLSFQNIQPRGLHPQPKERDTALALLCVFAQLAKLMLDPTIDEHNKNEQANLYAIALCRLSASFPAGCSNALIVSTLIKRSLFWAGMILIRSEFALGTILNTDYF